MSALELRLVAVAIACFASAVALGVRVTHGPPLFLDQLAPWVFGRATATAAALTITGYGPAIAGVMAVAVVAAFWLRVGLGPVAAVIAAQLLSQGTVTLLKPVFHRYRPDEWLFRHEMGFSFPSGHATTAVAFYGGLLVLAAGSPLPVAAKAFCCVALAAWALGICWSRVALGAHYPTDVAGGMLVGASFLCIALAVVARARA